YGPLRRRAGRLRHRGDIQREIITERDRYHVGGRHSREILVLGPPQRDERADSIGKHRAAGQQRVDLLVREEEDVGGAVDDAAVTEPGSDGEGDPAKPAVKKRLL